MNNFQRQMSIMILSLLALIILAKFIEEINFWIQLIIAFLALIISTKAWNGDFNKVKKNKIFKKLDIDKLNQNDKFILINNIQYANNEEVYFALKKHEYVKGKLSFIYSGSQMGERETGWNILVINNLRSSFYPIKKVKYIKKIT